MVKEENYINRSEKSNICVRTECVSSTSVASSASITSSLSPPFGSKCEREIPISCSKEIYEHDSKLIDMLYDVEHLATFAICDHNNKDISSKRDSDRIKSENVGSDTSEEVGSCCESKLVRCLSDVKNKINRDEQEFDGSELENHHDIDIDIDIQNKSHEIRSIKEANEKLVSSPRDALSRLFELEKLSGIWTQRMQIKLINDQLEIIDCESCSTVERYNRNQIEKPEAFNKINDLYNNILLFIVRQDQDIRNNKLEKEHLNKRFNSFKKGEVYIFQCVSRDAQRIVKEIQAWKLSLNKKFIYENKCDMVNDQESKKGSEMVKSLTGDVEGQTNIDNKQISIDHEQEHKTGPTISISSNSKPVITVASKAGSNDIEPLVNVNVRETVQVFNQIAASREKSKSGSPTHQTSNRSKSGNIDSGSDLNSSSSGLDNQKAAPHLQLYKQRSIRASLGPKRSNGNNKSKPSNDSANCSFSPASSLFDSKPASSLQMSSNSDSQVDERANRSADIQQVDQINNDNMNNNKTNTNNDDGDDDDNQRDEDDFSDQGRNLNAGRTQSTNESKQKQHQLNHHHHHHHPPHSREDKIHQKGSMGGESSYGQHQTVSSLNSPDQSHSNNIYQQQQQRNATRSHASSSSTTTTTSPDQVTTNESYVSVLNHCFDDIERFIMRLQQASAAHLEAQSRRKASRKHSTDQRNERGSLKNLSDSPNINKFLGPDSEDYFEIFSKFKLAFNLLAKLKGCIHDPNAPELVHFLFTPLLIIIESARSAQNPIDPTLVGIPFLNQDALDLLSNCCNSKEFELWMSLGPNWTQTVDPQLLQISRLPTSFQPVFTDGWAPVIGELELIGLIAPQNVSLRDVSATSDFDELSPSQQAAYAASNNLEQYVSSSKVHNKPNKKRNAAIPVKPGQHSDEFSDPKYEHLTSNYQRGITNMDTPYGGDMMIANKQRNPSYGKRQTRSYHERAIGHDGAPYNEQDFNDFDGPTTQPMNVHRNRALDKRRSNLSSEFSEGYMDGPVGYSNMAQMSRSSHYAGSDQFMASPRYPQSRQYYQRALSGHPNSGPLDDRVFLDEADQESLLMELGEAQTEWFFELQSRRALIARVLFSREANNEKELSVRRGELLEVLDHSRRWWKARNIDMEVAFVPHTIVAIMRGNQTLEELLVEHTSDFATSESRNSSEMTHRGRLPHRKARQEHHQSTGQIAGKHNQWVHKRDLSMSARSNSTSGPFRYF